jgi:hypothetical protein
MVSYDGELRVYFAPRDNEITPHDYAKLTIPHNKHRDVAAEFCSLAGGNRINTSKFVVIADLTTKLPTNEGPISARGISSVTAVALYTD